MTKRLLLIPLVPLVLLLVWGTGLFLAAGFNFGYEFHPQFWPIAAVLWAAASLCWLALRLIGRPSRRWLLAIGFAIPFLGLGGVVADVLLGAPDPNEAERRDAPLLAQVRPFPSSRVLGQWTVRIPLSGDFAEEGFLSSTEGYTLARSDRLPTGATVSEANLYYRRALKRAGFRPRSFGMNPGVDIIGRGDDALIEITIQPDAKNRLQADLLADYKGNSGCQSPSDVGCW